MAKPPKPSVASALVTMSKADFADLCEVSRGRVSHWIAEGKITGDALVGEGRGARVVVEIAQQQLRKRMDIGQRMGNGLGTKLDAVPPRPAPPEAYVWAHMRPAPAYAALVAMTWGATLRTAYLTYRSTALMLAGQYRIAFDAEAPGDFEPIGLDFLREEFGVSPSPDDLPAWDQEFARQWDEPADEAA